MKGSILDYLQTSTTNTLYQSFCKIDRMSYNTIIRFFNEHVEEIKSLLFDEYFDVLTTYVHALFEAGAYQQYAQMADIVIEASIINNIRVFHGIDIYEKTLFQKAVALHHLHSYRSSAHILTELIKMNPNNKGYRDFLIKNRFQIKPNYLRIAQSTAIAFFFFYLFIIALSSIFLEPFQPQWAEKVEIIRNGSFLAGTGILVISDSVHRLRIIMGVLDIVKRAREKMKVS